MNEDPNSEGDLRKLQQEEEADKAASYAVIGSSYSVKSDVKSDVCRLSLCKQVGTRNTREPIPDT